MQKELDTTIIMCVYNRPHYLKEQLDHFNKQTLKLPMLIVNNNKDRKDEFEDLLKNSGIRLIHSDKNIGGMARFTAARDLVKSKHVIFIDDDQAIKHNMIQHLAQNAINGIAGLWCFSYKKNASRFRITEGPAQYIGTGGQIALRKMFESEGLYSEYPKQPQPFLPPLDRPCMEDLWLSFYCRNRLKLKTISCGKLERYARNMNRDTRGNLICKEPGNTNITWNYKPKFVKWMREYFGEAL